MSKKQPTKPVIRTSAGLRDALFDTLDNLRTGKISPTSANATAKIAAAIVSTVEMELEVHRIMNRIPNGNAQALLEHSLPPLKLS